MDYTTTINNIFAGDTTIWEVKHDHFRPSAGFNCKVSLINASSPKTSFTADNDTVNDKFVITLTNSTSSLITPGIYRVFFQFYNNSMGEVKNYEHALIEIKPDITSLDTYDTRSSAKKRLDALYALKDDRFVEGIQNFSFNGRSITFMTMTEIEKEIQIVKNEVEKELKLDELKSKGYTNRNRIRIVYNGMKVS